MPYIGRKDINKKQKHIVVFNLMFYKRLKTLQWRTMTIIMSLILIGLYTCIMLKNYDNNNEGIHWPFKLVVKLAYTVVKKCGPT